MNRADYQQVKEIFQAALDVAPDSLDSYLNEQCSDNAVIRQEVEKLLDSYESGYLETPAIKKFAEAMVSSKIEAGQEIGHYKIVKKIGAGGMGEVFLAEDINLARLVAIKILPKAFAEDAERMNRFVREAKTASALNHPNIITIHEISTEGDTHFIATEYIEGETLRSHLANQSASFKTELEIAIQIASALDAAHHAGIIHRDIKPENVMIRPDGLVKILDFGIAKLSVVSALADASSKAATTVQTGTNPGIIIGTANYMSPEQAQGKKVDARSDIFSFGIVLYEMLSGKRAFEGENAMDVISSILKDEPKPIHQLLPEVPHEIERIVGKTLRKNRDERYQTARGLLTDLKDAKQELEFQDKLERTTPPHREQAKTQLSDIPHTTSSAEFITQEVKKHKRGFAVALVVLLSAAIGLGYWFFANRVANTKQIESIAVMPFINDSGNADAEYLSDGMTETLISSLSRLSNLNVKARSTVFRYKGKSMDAQTIGKELNVQAVLNGRFAQRGDQLTLTLELVDVQTENIIWSEQYNRKQNDLVSLITEIAQDVSGKLRIKLSGADEQKLVKKSTENSEAYRLCLLGQFYIRIDGADPENLRKAIEQFKAALEIDPNYALAYAGLAHSYRHMPQYWKTPTSESLPQAKAYANRAIALDDSLSFAHSALGSIYEQEWNWAEAEKEHKRALELDPNDPMAHLRYSNLLYLQGRSDEDLAESKRAIEIDPMLPALYHSIAVTYLDRGDLDLAEVNAKKKRELEPTATTLLSWIYFKQGRNNEALAEAHRNVEVSKRSSYPLSQLGNIQARLGNRKEALAIVKELEERYKNRKADRDDVAMVYAGLGENDKAFALLEEAFQNREWVQVIRNAVGFEPLRSDPRFNDLMRRIGLPEVH